MLAITYADLADYLAVNEELYAYYMQQVPAMRTILVEASNDPSKSIYLYDLCPYLDCQILADLMNLSEESTIGLQQSMAIDIVRAYSRFWLTFTNGNNLPEQVISLCEGALNSVDSDNARDDCGNLVFGSGDQDWPTVIQGKLTELTAYIENLAAANPPTYLTHNTYLVKDTPWTEEDLAVYDAKYGGAIDRTTVNSVDPDSVALNPQAITGFVGHSIDTALGLDPDYYVNLDQQYLTAQIAKGPYGVLYKRSVGQDFGLFAWTNPVTDGLKAYESALSNLAQMILTEVPLLGEICDQISWYTSCFMAYNCSFYYDLLRRLTKL